MATKSDSLRGYNKGTISSLLCNSRVCFHTRFTHARHHHFYNLALRSAFGRVHCLGVNIQRDPAVGVTQ